MRKLYYRITLSGRVKGVSVARLPCVRRFVFWKSLFLTLSIFGHVAANHLKVFVRDLWKHYQRPRKFSPAALDFIVGDLASGQKCHSNVSKLVNARVFCRAKESGRFSFLKDQITTIVLTKHNILSQCVSHIAILWNYFRLVASDMGINFLRMSTTFSLILSRRFHYKK